MHAMPNQLETLRNHIPLIGQPVITDIIAYCLHGPPFYAVCFGGFCRGTGAIKIGGSWKSSWIIPYEANELPPTGCRRHRLAAVTPQFSKGSVTVLFDLRITTAQFSAVPGCRSLIFGCRNPLLDALPRIRMECMPSLSFLRTYLRWI